MKTTANKGRKSRLDPPPRGTLEDTLAELRAWAAVLDIPDDVLAAWYGEQVVAVAIEASDTLGKLERNLAALERPDDPRWARWYLQEVRFEYLWRTLELLLCRGHVLACPSHGPMGITVAVLDHAVFGAVPAHAEPLTEARAWDALAARGALTGDGATTWSRYCLDCAASGIEFEAGKRHERDRKVDELGKTRRRVA